MDDSCYGVDTSPEETPPEDAPPEDAPPEDAPPEGGDPPPEVDDVGVHPGDVFLCVEIPHKTLVDYGRVHNFTVVNDKKESNKGTGCFRGGWYCTGCNTTEHNKDRKAKVHWTPCPWHIPYTYSKLDKSILIKEASYVFAKDGSKRKVAVPYCVTHNHAMHGVLNLTSATGELIMVKSLDKQLSPAERGLITVFKGTHVGVPDIMVSNRQLQLLYLPVTACHSYCNCL
jgi:hypothetical protein